jgi:hypothetical protein
MPELRLGGALLPFLPTGFFLRRRSYLDAPYFNRI